MEFLCGYSTRVLIRQVLAAVAQFEKTCIVAKLRDARDRIRNKTGRCEGPLPFGQDPARPSEAGVCSVSVNYGPCVPGCRCRRLPMPLTRTRTSTPHGRGQSGTSNWCIACCTCAPMPKLPRLLEM